MSCGSEGIGSRYEYSRKRCPVELECQSQQRLVMKDQSWLWQSTDRKVTKRQQDMAAICVVATPHLSSWCHSRHLKTRKQPSADTCLGHQHINHSLGSVKAFIHSLVNRSTTSGLRISLRNCSCWTSSKAFKVGPGYLKQGEGTVVSFGRERKLSFSTRE